jgi:G3E family GTPase
VTHDLNSSGQDNLGQISLNTLLPERPAIVGEFSPAYEAYRQVTVADLAPVTQYEYIQALQLVDLNWSILQLKASAHAELSHSTEEELHNFLEDKLFRDADRAFDEEYDAFIETGGDEDDFEGSIDRQKIERDATDIVEGLKSQEPAKREAATAQAISLGVDPRLVLSGQMLGNRQYQRYEAPCPIWRSACG